MIYVIRNKCQFNIFLVVFTFGLCYDGACCLAVAYREKKYWCSFVTVVLSFDIIVTHKVAVIRYTDKITNIFILSFALTDLSFVLNNIE